MRGIVVDVNENRAIILKADSCYVNVKNKGYKIGQKVNTMSKTVNKCLKIAACLALLVVTSAFAYKFYYTPFSYIYIDINPSVRLDLNYFDKVIDCTPLNDDASFIEISSSDVEDSITEVIEKCEEKGFLNENNNDIEINMSEDNDRIRTYVSDIEERYKNTQYKVVVKNTTKKEEEAANKNGISVKRQRTIDAFTDAFGGDAEENIEKLREKTTEEIMMLISEEQNKETENAPELPENIAVVSESKAEQDTANAYTSSSSAAVPQTQNRKPTKPAKDNNKQEVPQAPQNTNSSPSPSQKEQGNTEDETTALPEKAPIEENVPPMQDGAPNEGERPDDENPPPDQKDDDTTPPDGDKPTGEKPQHNEGDERPDDGNPPPADKGTPSSSPAGDKPTGGKPPRNEAGGNPPPAEKGISTVPPSGNTDRVVQNQHTPSMTNRV